MPDLNGKVAIVTGAGRGIGREHALALARAGAKIVVNDLGASLAGEGADTGPAHDVVREIESLGGEAVADGENVADYGGAKRMVDRAIESFGRLDILVNNAGILRDRMLVNMEEHEWDAVIEVHLKGHFAPTRHAAAHWRERSKAGEEVRARVINTSSPSGVFGNVGQANYGAAKAGIVGFTLIAAQELQRYGVTVNRHGRPNGQRPRIEHRNAVVAMIGRDDPGAVGGDRDVADRTAPNVDRTEQARLGTRLDVGSSHHHSIRHGH